MAINFWEAQKKARSRTTLYLVLFVTMAIAIAAGAELAMRQFAGDAYHPPEPLVAVGFLVVTIGVAAFQYMLYNSQGGSYVAESVGGQLIDPNTSNFHYQQVLNIVQEIALASGMPVPPVYLIPAEDINAFAAGMNPDNAAIAITVGALKKLNRDELQGVIAHEFGHIYNGDMKISMRLAAMVMGFFIALYIGMRLLEFSSFSRRSRDNEKGGNPLVILALVFVVSGVITWIAGSILKASVSRQREYLADACAVQFTRNPNGIANALRKIAAIAPKNDMPSSGMSISHMYFNDHSFLSNLFATHPPLEKRIAALEGREYIPEEWNIPSQNGE